jgi:hypothetical protein
MRFVAFAFCSFLLLACSSQEQKIAEDIQPQSDFKQKIYQDENGNFINEDGWEVPKFETNKKVLIGEENLLNANGEMVKIYFYSYTSRNEVIIKEPFASQELNEKYASAQLISITESKRKDQSPYRYIFTVKKKAETPKKTNGNMETYLTR